MDESAIPYSAKPSQELGGHSVRTIQPPEGGTWYCSRDVALALGYDGVLQLQYWLGSIIGGADRKKFRVIDGSGRRGLFPAMWFYRRAAVRRLVEEEKQEPRSQRRRVAGSVPPEPAPLVVVDSGEGEGQLEQLADALVSAGSEVRRLLRENERLKKKLTDAEGRLDAIRRVIDPRSAP